VGWKAIHNGFGVMHFAWELKAAYPAAITVTDFGIVPDFGEFISRQYAHDRAHDTHMQMPEAVRLCMFLTSYPFLASHFILKV
jgi:hypothetical protein